MNNKDVGFPELNFDTVQSVEIDKKVQEISEGEFIVDLSFDFGQLVTPEPLEVKWKLPAINVKGVWKSVLDANKRLQYDWEQDHVESRISVEAPVVSIFGHDDLNVCTFACDNAVDLVQMNALLREENNHVYCHLKFFTETHPQISSFRFKIRIDLRPLLYSDSLRHVSKWWESLEYLKPAIVPSIAEQPVYSTWYNFHQKLDHEVLKEECTLAKSFGYEVVILDDGWQTFDTNRGYDYTGDWKPERFPDMREFVKSFHDIGMKVGLWFSVPFCGKKSEAYLKFKGKFLTENNRWAPVFDPRYPEVRDYLVSIYRDAVSNWSLDGLKLDFIDEFTVYPETKLTKDNGRDFASVNEAVHQLMLEVKEAVQKVNPDIFIEFRQRYTGPALRKFGNMFRAFDCPNDSNTNRVRITDLRLLCGQSAVHSDMLTWHSEEKVEIAALQFVNILFSVPQISVRLNELSEHHALMVRFYTNYWLKNKSLLLGNSFYPTAPLSGYPIIKVQNQDTAIVGVYGDSLVSLDTSVDHIHLINGKTTDYIVVYTVDDAGFSCSVLDCMGNTYVSSIINFKKDQTMLLNVPVSGMILLTKNKQS